MVATVGRTMRRMLMILVLAAATLALPAAASAQSFPGERPATDPWVPELVQLGLKFWQARGVEPCVSPEVLMSSDLDLPEHGQVSVGGRARLGACAPGTGETTGRMWLLERLITDARDLWTGGAPTRTVCAVVVHELGHLAGLEHTDGGAMNGSSGGDKDTPWECWVWARRIDRIKDRVTDRLLRAERRCQRRAFRAGRSGSRCVRLSSRTLLLPSEA